MTSFKDKVDLFTGTAASTDTQALVNLAGWYRAVSYERSRGRTPADGEMPGPHITSIQLEWAAREIDKLRGAA